MYSSRCALHFCSARPQFTGGQHRCLTKAALNMSHGFFHTVVHILHSLDVLVSEALRQGVKKYSSWPTFQQHYIDGEFIRGCDITVGMLFLEVGLEALLLQ